MAFRVENISEEKTGARYVIFVFKIFNRGSERAG